MKTVILAALWGLFAFSGSAFCGEEVVATRHIYMHVSDTDEKCDDINPVWLNDPRRIIAFERDEKVSRIQNLWYFVQFPGVGEKPFDREISSMKEQGAGRKFQVPMISDPEKKYRFYDGYFSWAPDNSRRFVFIRSHKTLVIGEAGIETKGVEVNWNTARTADWIKLRVNNIRTAWSVNDEIVFVSELSGNGDLYLAKAPSSVDKRSKDPPKLQLTSSDALDTEPNWSPDGRSLVYTSNHAGSKHIYLLEEVAQVHSSGPVVTGKRLLDRETEEANPVWSPDGNKIAFYTMTEESGESVNLWVMNSDGSNPMQLDTRVKRNAQRGPSWIRQKDLGDKIVYVSLTRTGDFIYMVDVDTREKWRVETGTEMNKNVSCAPGEDPYIAFAAHDRAGRMRIYIKELALP